MSAESSIASRYRAIKATPDLLPQATLRELMQRRPLRATVAIAGEWLGLGLAVALYEVVSWPGLYPLLVAWIGARMLGLWVLAHDGLHHLLFRNRRLNDAVTRTLLAWPLFVSLSEFRRVHLEHHRHLKTPRDPETALAEFPDFRFPHSRAHLLGILLMDLSGINFVRFFVKKRYRALRHLAGSPSHGRRGWPRPGKLAYYGGALGLVAAWGLWRELALFWLVPYATWYTLVLRLRLMAEHLHLPESDHLQTRTILPCALERWFFVPHHVSYHAEHHLYPGVPCYRLPRLHGLLRQHGEFAERAPLRRGYLRTLGEFARAEVAADSPSEPSRSW